MEVSLGKGPAIKVRDGGMISDPRVVQWMVRSAEASGLPYQLEVLEGGTTDACYAVDPRRGSCWLCIHPMPLHSQSIRNGGHP